MAVSDSLAELVCEAAVDAALDAALEAEEAADEAEDEAAEAAEVAADEADDAREETLEAADEAADEAEEPPDEAEEEEPLRLVRNAKSAVRSAVRQGKAYQSDGPPLTVVGAPLPTAPLLSGQTAEVSIVLQQERRAQTHGQEDRDLGALGNGDAPRQGARGVVDGAKFGDGLRLVVGRACDGSARGRAVLSEGERCVHAEVSSLERCSALLEQQRTRRCTGKRRECTGKVRATGWSFGRGRGERRGERRSRRGTRQRSGP